MQCAKDAIACLINRFFILTHSTNTILSFHRTTAPSGPGPPHYRGFTITLRNTTIGRTPLDEWSARCRDLYLTTHNAQKTRTSVPPAEFEPVIPASEQPQTHAFNRWENGVGRLQLLYIRHESQVIPNRVTFWAIISNTASLNASNQRRNA